MKTDEIRDEFLKFFEERGHRIVPSASLVPEDDPTLLFTGAGMNQFKELFLGVKKADFTRAASCQKCLRTGDIENVGKTAYHHTFFEMLGNFSFGDYFKEEAIVWAWEFVRDVLGLPEERLWITIYEEDEEAFQIWHKKVGISEEKIIRLGAEHNFWPANAPKLGPNGPCGPCSEIHYDRGEEFSCGAECEGITCKCDRFCEVWNLVFTQYDRQPDGSLKELPRKNIDTGMGLERVASILQGTRTNYEIDIIKPIIDEICKIAGVEYGKSGDMDVVLRLIADHARASAFAVGDGVVPSNEGRGYVLRRLIRRALERARYLGLEEAFLYRLVPVVGRVMEKPYPEVKKAAEHIAFIVKTEEERFLGLLDRALPLLEEELSKLGEEGVLAGERAFVYYDTYGLPLDVIKDVAERFGVVVDEDGFSRALDEQRRRAREKSAIKGEIFAVQVHKAYEIVQEVEFVGYDRLSEEGTILAITHGDKLIEEIGEEEKAEIVLDRTPFYGEAGGQVGDTGIIKGEGGEFCVEDTKRFDGLIVHRGRVRKGAFKRGDKVLACVDEERRRAIMRHHTATHLLQAALREVLGEHVQQAGSLVAPDRLRFDFTHFAAVPERELLEVERIVMEKICENIPVETFWTRLDEAKKMGVIALFGEKYGEEVRVVKIGEVSAELCGGTHVRATGDIGAFIIGDESAVAAGVRRVEAYTGLAALEWVNKMRTSLLDISALLKTSPADVQRRIEGLLKRVKELERFVEKMQSSGASSSIDAVLENAREVNGIKIVAAKIEVPSRAALRNACDRVRAAIKKGVVLLAAELDGKAAFVVGVTEDIKERVKAGELVKEVAKIAGGGGGGKPTLAEGGGDAGKIEEAVAQFYNIVEGKL